MAFVRAQNLPDTSSMPLEHGGNICLQEKKMITQATTLIDALLRLRSMRSHDHWTREQLQAHQDTSLASLRQFASLNSPFYRAFHKGFADAPLEALPVLTKSVMMEHFDEFVTDQAIRLNGVRTYLDNGAMGRFRQKYEVAATSGSTGNPGIFLFNRQEWATIMASFARAREWAGLKVNLTKRSPMAVVSSTNEKNLSARVGKAANTPFLPTLRLDANEPMEKLVAKLNRWQPDVLVAYSSMAYFLSQEQERGELHIAPKTIFTSSEVLTPHMRENIERVWGNVVFNEYASTETATIAAEDMRHHGMHIFEDLLIVENVDANNRRVAPGEFGQKLLVTVLFSRTQPLIRYEISDSVRIAAEQPSCSLPFSVIDGVQGRREDILTMAGVAGGRVQVHPVLFHDVMDVVPNRGWQIVQEQDRLTIFIVDTESIPESALKRNLATALERKGVVVPRIEIEKVSAIPKSQSGKSPLIKAAGPVTPL
jgi:putative adenylate-forming enzyme